MLALSRSLLRSFFLFCICALNSARRIPIIRKLCINEQFSGVYWTDWKIHSFAFAQQLCYPFMSLASTHWKITKENTNLIELFPFRVADFGSLLVDGDLNIRFSLQFDSKTHKILKCAECRHTRIPKTQLNCPRIQFRPILWYTSIQSMNDWAWVSRKKNSKSGLSTAAQD